MLAKELEGVDLSDFGPDVFPESEPKTTAPAKPKPKRAKRERKPLPLAKLIEADLIYSKILDEEERKKG